MNDQRSLREQLETLYGLANKNGLYDAADWLKGRVDEMKQRETERTRTRLTDPQKRLLDSLRAEEGEKGAWVEILADEVLSAEALARKGLIRIQGPRQHLEAQLIEGEPGASSETRPVTRT